MTHRERFIKTLKCEPIGGQVPHWEIEFQLTMEAFGKMHPDFRAFRWDQLSYGEKKAQMRDMAQLYVDVARRYDHSAIHIQPNPVDFANTVWLMEEIRDISGDEYYLTMHGDPTLWIPNGDDLLDFSVEMYEEPQKVKDRARSYLDRYLNYIHRIASHGHLPDGLTCCSDYAYNANSYFSPELFAEFVAPYLKEAITEYHKMGFICIKHSDGNLMPILKQIADCGPDAIQSLDPQGCMKIPEVRKLIGDKICLIGNVNCGLLDTGTDEECRADIMRSLREGMERGYGYVFGTSNCIYTGMRLERYEMMHKMWKIYGNYDVDNRY